MNQNLEADLKKCLSLINSEWQTQNNYMDKKTNFIYKCNSLDDCINEIQKTGVDKEYALHRWYNYMTSVACEYLFCDYGATHDNNTYNHDTDIYINEIPFDVKLTIYPAKLNNRPYNLNTRKGKNQMIEWYYANQSQQSRKQLLNRIYVVCDGNTPYECLKMKSDFKLLRAKISAFMKYSLVNGINQIEIIDNSTKYTLMSDIVYITYNN